MKLVGIAVGSKALKPGSQFRDLLLQVLPKSVDKRMKKKFQGQRIMEDTKPSRFHPRGGEDRNEYQKAGVRSADEEGELELSSRVLLPSLPIA